jgi:hypothetical protein
MRAHGHCHAWQHAPPGLRALATTIATPLAPPSMTFYFHHMNLPRCSAQKGQSLDEFYGEMVPHETGLGTRTGSAMLSLLARLRAIPDDRSVWGLTSLSRLCLLSQDLWHTPWHVVFCAVGGKDDYVIEYLMPEASAPWPNAYVRGEARSEDEAVQMILTAMERSEGWKTPPSPDGGQD